MRLSLILALAVLSAGCVNQAQQSSCPACPDVGITSCPACPDVQNPEDADVVFDPPDLPADVFKKDWAQDPIWDDGQAEVSKYESQRIVYSKPRVFETTTVVVKEDFRKDEMVKAELPYDGKDTVTVLKLNIIQNIQTIAYAYYYMTSVFTLRQNPTYAVKMSVTSHEWCGNTYKQYNGYTSPKELLYHTYFEGHGGGVQELEGFDGLTEDQLFVTLRSLDFERYPSFKVKILPSIISNNARYPQVREFDFETFEGENVATQNETFKTYKVVAKSDVETLTYWFERGYPNRLVMFESSDGRSLKLINSTRYNYWDIE